MITLNISEKEINKNIYFLNGTDNQNMAKNEEIINLKKEDCDLFINDDLYEFNSSFKPEKKGEYKIKLLFKKRLKNCSYMFNNCDNIIKLDLSLFNSSEIMNMHYMFGKCHFLNEINLTSFKTDKVINMSYLFNKCDYSEYEYGILHSEKQLYYQNLSIQVMLKTCPLCFIIVIF